MPEIEKCPICGGLWYDGECYKCGAYMEAGKVVVPKPETPQPPPPPPPPEVPPVRSTRPWDDP